MSLPKFVSYKLEVLGYKGTAALDNPNFQKIVLWLEEEKIRLWAQNERVKLREVNAGGKWIKAAKEYLKELGVDESQIEKLAEKTQTNRLEIVDTLLAMAIHDEYQDAVEEGRVVVPEYEGSVKEKPNALDLIPLLAPLNQILSYNGLPTLSNDVTNEDIAAAIAILHRRLAEGTGAKVKEEIDLNKVPIGVDLGQSESKKLRRAVAILRFLHNANMREFQAQINDVINQLQAYTADPKTDAALGRVGR